jgi:hypothetical protein
MTTDYITKSFKLHTTKDRELIRTLNEYSETKALSRKIIEILKLYFSMKEEERNDFNNSVKNIEKMLKELKASGIKSIAAYNVNQSIPSTVVRENKNIAELMGGLFEQSDDNIDLSL